MVNRRSSISKGASYNLFEESDEYFCVAKRINAVAVQSGFK